MAAANVTKAAATPEIVVVLAPAVVAPPPSHSTLYVRDFSSYVAEEINSHDEVSVVEVGVFSSLISVFAGVQFVHGRQLPSTQYKFVGLVANRRTTQLSNTGVDRA